jgi:hypothetical protein
VRVPPGILQAVRLFLLPAGTWYLDANSYRVTAEIWPASAATPSTMTDEGGPVTTLDNIVWDPWSGHLTFRRNGPGFWQWYRVNLVEGVLAGRFSHSAQSSAEPDPSEFRYHVTGWNSTYLDLVDVVPRAYEVQFDDGSLARLRIDRQTTGDLIGTFKIYKDKHGNEQLEQDVSSLSWDGSTLLFAAGMPYSVGSNDPADFVFCAESTGRTLAGMAGRSPRLWNSREGQPIPRRLADGDTRGPPRPHDSGQSEPDVFVHECGLCLPSPSGLGRRYRP